MCDKLCSRLNAIDKLADDVDDDDRREESEVRTAKISLRRDSFDRREVVDS
jgi:hypothetical protein